MNLFKFFNIFSSFCWMGAISSITFVFVAKTYSASSLELRSEIKVQFSFTISFAMFKKVIWNSTYFFIQTILYMSLQDINCPHVFENLLIWNIVQLQSETLLSRTDSWSPLQLFLWLCYYICVWQRIFLQFQ